MHVNHEFVTRQSQETGAVRPAAPQGLLRRYSGRSRGRGPRHRPPLAATPPAVRNSARSRHAGPTTPASGTSAGDRLGQGLGRERRQPGLLLSPYPRKSVITTVKSCARAGATRCHMTCVCGWPCSSSGRAGAAGPGSDHDLAYRDVAYFETIQHHTLHGGVSDPWPSDEVRFFSLWERHLVTAVAISEGWLPRWYRGWKPLP